MAKMFDVAAHSNSRQAFRVCVRFNAKAQRGKGATNFQEGLTADYADCPGRTVKAGPFNSDPVGLFQVLSDLGSRFGLRQRNSLSDQVPLGRRAVKGNLEMVQNVPSQNSLGLVDQEKSPAESQPQENKVKIHRKSCTSCAIKTCEIIDLGRSPLAASRSSTNATGAAGLNRTASYLGIGDNCGLKLLSLLRIRQTGTHYPRCAWLGHTGNDEINLRSFGHVDILRQLDLPVHDDAFKRCYIHDLQPYWLSDTNAWCKPCQRL
ncbi:MAG: hypothetical protein C5B50_00050 [Verrucomicrobia bacterium]|nr:MAG: hypothetical protein C5B50_00050 [Verrucomicrobiota bacterium]